MRNSGYNERGINAEPMNGMGVYPARQTINISWCDAVRGGAKVLSIAFSVRSLIGKHLPITWVMVMRASAVLALGYHITQRVSAKTLGLFFAVRQGVGQTVLPAWEVRQFVNGIFPIAFDLRNSVESACSVPWAVREYAGQSCQTLWHDAAGILKALRILWRVPFSTRSASVLSTNGAQSNLTQHVDRTGLSTAKNSGALTQHTTTSPIGG